MNGRENTHDVEGRLLLVHYLRDVLGLTGTHVGCETSLCGACTVLLTGRAFSLDREACFMNGPDS